MVVDDGGLAPVGEGGCVVDVFVRVAIGVNATTHSFLPYQGGIWDI